MKYYISDSGQTLQVSGDTGLFTVPEGFREVSAEEYAAQSGDVILDLDSPHPHEEQPQ